MIKIRIRPQSQEDFLQPHQCEELIQYYHNNSHLSYEFGHEGLRPRRPLEIPENTKEFRFLQGILNEKVGVVNNSVVHYIHIVRWPIGSEQDLHYDNAQDYTTLASIIYLNDNLISFYKNL